MTLNEKAKQTSNKYPILESFFCMLADFNVAGLNKSTKKMIIENLFIIELLSILIYESIDESQWNFLLLKKLHS